MVINNHASTVERLRAHIVLDENDILDLGTLIAQGIRPAAVSVILRMSSGAELEVLLIRRAERADDAWSGDIALPGGHHEEGDGSLEMTALREVQEEVAIDLAKHAKLIGLLPGIMPFSSALPSVGVQPFVWIVDRPELAKASVSSEVAATAWVSLAHLSAPENQCEYLISATHGTKRAFAATRVPLASPQGAKPAVVWGMTHRVISTLLEIL